MDFLFESLGLFWIVFIFGLPILYLVGLWMLYGKMGEPGWVLFVPIYRQYVLFKRVWKPAAYGWYVIFSIVSFASILYMIIQFSLFVATWNTVAESSLLGGVLAVGLFLISYFTMIYIHLKRNWRLSRCFGHGFGCFLGITFFPVVFIPVLAFGDSRYYREVYYG